MRSPYWRASLAIVLIVAGLSAIPGAFTVVFLVVLGLSPIGIVAGVRMHRTQPAESLYLSAAAGAVWFVGDLLAVRDPRSLAVTAGLAHTSHVSAGDVVHLLGHPLAFLAMMMMVRRRQTGSDLAGVVDAALAAASTALISWVCLIDPVLSTPGVPADVRVVVSMYPVLDVVMLALMARVLTQPMNRTPAFWLLAVATTLLVTGDGALTYAKLSNRPPWPGHGIQMFAVLALVGAVWHPSMKSFFRSAPIVTPFTWMRFVTLVAAMSVAPGTLAVQTIFADTVDSWAIISGAVVICALVMARMVIMVRRAEEQSIRLRMLARTDHLTGLANRRTADAELARAVARSREAGTPLTIAMLDLDHFKVYNDTNGHPAGDRLLAAAATVWQEKLRAGETLARFGGEEFVLISTRSPAELARLTDRLRVITPAGQTFSAGVAGWNRVEPISDLLSRADQALYVAKEGGRRRTVVSAAGQPRGRGGIRRDGRRETAAAR